MEEKFDCIIVGGGVAGLSAAMVLARADVRFLLIERGSFCGAKNVSGGILWGRDLAKLVPDASAHGDGVERFINHRRLSFLDDQSAFSVDFKSDHFSVEPHSGVSVLRSRFDAWLATQVESEIEKGSNAENSFLATDILVEAVLREEGRVTGIRAGGEDFYANTVILAEGVNNLLARQIGLEMDYVPADYMAVGVKEVISFERSVLEDRFQLSGDSGLTNEFVGWCSDGVSGGGFLYTNRESVSVGLVLSIKDLREKRKTPYDLLNQFKSHTAVQDMLREGTVSEYSAHTVSTGDIRAVPKKLFGNGVLLSGEAAHLLLNAGRAIQGMDYAMRSGILAGEAVLAAKEAGDFSEAQLSGYQTALENSYIMKDMKQFQDAVHLMHEPAMASAVPNLICDFGRGYFTVDSKPSEKASTLMRAAIKRNAGYWDLIKLGTRAIRSL